MEVQLCWPEDDLRMAGMLLLVAVEPAHMREGRGIPCRVLGRWTPGSPFGASEAAEPPQARASALLTAVGVPANLRGYAYLCTALGMALEHPETLRGLNRQLYPAIAQEHGATAPAVERAIRHAITQTWARGGGERCRELLGRAFSCVGDKPSNGEFLSLLAQRLRLEQGRR